MSASDKQSNKRPPIWPAEEFQIDTQKLTLEQFQELEQLINSNSGEKAIDTFIRRYPHILYIALMLASTGNHGAWVIPQQVIRVKIGTSQNGLIPDYIIGGKSSDGFEWWVVELKGADAKIFSQRANDIAFSKELNEGVCQLLTYIDYCAEIQSTLRDQFNLIDFREPKGLIVLGRESETNENKQKQKLKSAWNRITRKQLEIRTYDALLRAFREFLGLKKISAEKAIDVNIEQEDNSEPSREQTAGLGGISEHSASKSRKVNVNSGTDTNNISQDHARKPRNIMKEPWRAKMVDEEEATLFAFKSPNGFDGVCIVERIKISGKRVVIICEDVAGNPGISVTNAIEAIALQVCKAFKIRPKRTIWITRYPFTEILPEPEWELVTFEEMELTGFKNPTWTRLTTEDWQALGLRPRKRFNKNGRELATRVIRLKRK